MEALLTTEEKDLQHFFASLTEEEIQSLGYSKTYYRAVEYYENNHVGKAHFSADRTTLTAKVRGSENYKVQIQLANGEVHSICTCPFDGIVCKHGLAVMIFAINEVVEVGIAKNGQSSEDIKKYLHAQSKEKLVDLVLKYAPGEFLREIGNKHLNTTEATAVFKKAKRGVEELFRNGNVLYDPATFGDQLVKKITKLSGLEKSLSRNIAEFIIYIVEKIEDAIDDGYLYDQYNDYSFEPPEEFYEFITRFVSAISFNEKTDFIKRLEVTISNSSYTTFHDIYGQLRQCFAADELLELKALLISSYKDLPETVVETYYRQVSSTLSGEEKEKILEVLAHRDDSWAIELAELLNGTGRRNKSIPMLRRLISEEAEGLADEKLCFLYLDQMKAEKLDLYEAIMKCMKQCPSANMLRRATELLPSESTACEEILEKQSPEELLNYLESADRTMDGLALIKRNKDIWHDRVFTFYKKNKKTFSAEAEKYFVRTIRENLENTGDQYYYTIADSLKQLKSINKETAHQMILHLRQNYKRRSKLMSIISDI